jgi:hypothetical protein
MGFTDFLSDKGMSREYCAEKFLNAALTDS